MNVETLKMTDWMTAGSDSAEQLALARSIRASMRRLASSSGVFLAFLAVALWVRIPTQAEMAAWVIPEEAVAILEAPLIRSQDEIPSIAELAQKIPTSLVDKAAIDHKSLNSYSQRQSVAKYLVDKYGLDEASSMGFIDKALRISGEVGIDPTLILAVTAVESGFNPNAVSKKGAQGLMQVMTRVHADKYQFFGGLAGAFDPDINMRVGSLILREYIAKGGSLEAGLRMYVGATTPGIDDGGYGDKVLAERSRIKSAANQRVALIGKKAANRT